MRTAADSAIALGKLCGGNGPNQDAARRADVIPKLAHLLTLNSPSSLKSDASFALLMICSRNRTNQDVAREAGALTRLLGLLQGGCEPGCDVDIALDVLCDGHPVNQG